MERTTGYSLSITGLMQADGRIPPVASAPPTRVSRPRSTSELAARGIRIERTID
jgi:hypothetical protein